MYHLLIKLGYHIPENNKLIGHITFNQMRDAILHFFSKHETKADDTLVFYYSGHGIPTDQGDLCYQFDREG
jgi:hypothetical protein